MQYADSLSTIYRRGETWRLFRGFSQMPVEDQTILRRWFSIPDTISAFEACEVIEAAAPLQVREIIKLQGAEAFRTYSIQ
jgi:hypothetical protein